MPDNASIAYRKLRQTIGWLGISLPLMIYLHTIFLSDCDCVQDSISHYYYTSANVLFVGIFWGLGLVLFFYPAYKGESKIEAWLTSFAGICAICVSLFPTDPTSNDSCALFALSESVIRARIHYGSAAIMLCIFSYMSIFIFTKTYEGNDLKSDRDFWKRLRNRFYIICGVITLASVATIGVLTILENKFDFEFSSKYTYWLEVAALLPFGIAWIIKGGFMLTDEGDDSTLTQVKKFLTGKPQQMK